MVVDTVKKVISFSDMQTLYSILDTLQTLTALPASDKKEFIEQNKSIELAEILTYTSDNFSNYRPHKHVLRYAKVPTLTYAQFINALQTQDVNILRLIRKADYRYNDILLSIIYKTLHLGVHYKVLNTILNINTCRVDMMGCTDLNIHNIKFPLILDKVIDGIKCSATVQNNEARLMLQNGTLLSFDTLKSEVLRFAKGEDIAFDCILRADRGIDLDSIIRYNKRKHYIQDIDKLLQLVIYDENSLLPFIHTKSKKTLTQKDRLLNLQRRYTNFMSKYIKITKPQIVSTVNKLVELSSNKYILKQIDAKYVFVHSQQWMNCEKLYLSVLLITAYDIDNNIAICNEVSVTIPQPDAELYKYKPPVGKYIEVMHTSDTTNVRYARMRIDIETTKGHSKQ